MSVSAKVEALGRVTLLRRLKEETLRSLARCVDERSYAAGEVLVREGSLGLAMYFLTSGRCSVLHQTDAGPERVATLSAGDFFGEMAVLDPGPRTATIIADTDVTALAIAAWDFKAMMEADPQIPLTILPALARRFRAANTQLLQLGGEHAAHTL